MKALVVLGMLAGIFAAFTVLDWMEKGLFHIFSGFYVVVVLHVMMLIVLAIGFWQVKNVGRFLSGDRLGLVIAMSLSYLTFFVSGIFIFK